MGQKKTGVNNHDAEIFTNIGASLPGKIEDLTGSNAVNFTSPRGVVFQFGFTKTWNIKGSAFDVGGAATLGGYPVNYRFDISSTQYYKDNPHVVKIRRANIYYFFLTIGPKICIIPLKQIKKFSIGLYPNVRFMPGGLTSGYGETLSPQITDTLYTQTTGSSRSVFYGGLLELNYKIVQKSTKYFSVGIYTDYVGGTSKTSFVLRPGTAEFAKGNFIYRQTNFGIKIAFGI